MPILNNVFQVWALINIQRLGEGGLVAKLKCVNVVVDTPAANRLLWLMGLDRTSLSCQLSITHTQTFTHLVDWDHNEDSHQHKGTQTEPTFCDKTGKGLITKPVVNILHQELCGKQNNAVPTRKVKNKETFLITAVQHQAQFFCDFHFRRSTLGPHGGH